MTIPPPHNIRIVIAVHTFPKSYLIQVTDVIVSESGQS